MGRSLVSHLKRAVKNINFILRSLKLDRWKLASIIGCTPSASARRWLSFNDRLGLKGCFGDRKFDENERCLRRIQSSRARDHCKEDDDYDVDQRADDFIANFRRQLMFERQVSLQLRYCRGDSF